MVRLCDGDRLDGRRQVLASSPSEIVRTGPLRLKGLFHRYGVGGGLVKNW